MCQPHFHKWKLECGSCHSDTHLMFTLTSLWIWVNVGGELQEQSYHIYGDGFVYFPWPHQKKTHNNALSWEIRNRLDFKSLVTCFHELLNMCIVLPQSLQILHHEKPFSVILILKPYKAFRWIKTKGKIKNRSQFHTLLLKVRVNLNVTLKKMVR